MFSISINVFYIVFTVILSNVNNGFKTRMSFKKMFVFNYAK